jgi:hypothetical protein
MQGGNRIAGLVEGCRIGAEIQQRHKRLRPLFDYRKVEGHAALVGEIHAPLQIGGRSGYELPNNSVSPIAMAEKILWRAPWPGGSRQSPVGMRVSQAVAQPNAELVVIALADRVRAAFEEEAAGGFLRSEYSLMKRSSDTGATRFVDESGVRVEQFVEQSEVSAAGCFAQSVHKCGVRRGGFKESDVCFQFCPGCEAVFIGDYELGIAQGEAGHADCGFGRPAPTRMKLLNLFEGVRVRGAMASKDCPGLVF